MVEDNPLGEPGLRPRTFRLPTQDPVRLRRLGPRDFDEVPPLELAALLTEAAEEHGWDSRETLFRSVLARPGLVRLTTYVETRLSAVLDYAMVELGSDPES